MATSRLALLPFTGQAAASFRRFDYHGESKAERITFALIAYFALYLYYFGLNNRRTGNSAAEWRSTGLSSRVRHTIGARALVGT